VRIRRGRLSRYGYGNLVLEQVARDAGPTRGALYHPFDGKDDLPLASVDWVAATWDREVAGAVEASPTPPRRC
jgi:AcrR family transcriptional regulator